MPRKKTRHEKVHFVQLSVDHFEQGAQYEDMGYGKGEVEGQRGGEGGRRCFARGGLVFPMKILGIKCEQH